MIPRREPGGRAPEPRGSPTRAPRRYRIPIGLLCPPEDRSFVLADLDDEYAIRHAERGRKDALRWCRAQFARSTPPLLGRRLGRLGVAIPGSRPRGLPGSARARGQGGANIPDTVRDVGYAFRTLRRAPLVGLVTVLSLALGIGASTAVFTIANAFLFQESSGLVGAEDLVAIYTSGEDGEAWEETSFQDYLSVAEEVDAFRGVTAYRAGVLTLGEGEGSERVLVEIVTGNYFDVLGIRPPLGRAFLPEETQLGGARRVIVLSHDEWMTRFGGSRSVLGRTLTLDGEEFTVVGVAPEGLLSRIFRLKVAGWVPVGIPGGTYHSTPQELEDRQDRDYNLMARLAPEANREQAEAQLAVLAARLLRDYPEAWQDDRGNGRSFAVLSEKESRAPPDMRAALAGAAAFLLAVALMILLIACSNVASLFLARAHHRRREMAVRLSLGASRWRVVRMLLAESLLLALAGGAVGIVLARTATASMESLPLPLDLSIRLDVGMDYRVLLFALTLSVGAAALFGLAPALKASHPDLVPALKTERGVGGRRPGRFGFRSLLVMFQVAGSVILLVTAGLFLRSLRATATLDLGLDPGGVAVMSKQLDPEAIGPEEGRQYFLDLADRLRAVPGVESAELAGNADASLWGIMSRAVIEVPGWEAAEGGLEVVLFNPVTPGYMEMLRMTPVRGRTLDERDRLGAPPVAVVNETFARRYWEGEDPLGKRFTVTGTRFVDTPTDSSPRTLEVVGIMKDFPLSEEGATPPPVFWTSFLQDYLPMMVIHLKGRTSAEAMVRILRQEVEVAQGEIGLIAPSKYEDLVEARFMGYRIGSQVLFSAGIFSLLLAVMGIYGIVSFTVSQRLREMAIRQAIGARRNQVISAVIRDGMTLTAFGMVGGMAVVIPLSFLLRSAFYGVSPLDPLAVAGGVGLLLLAALAATAVPARRIALADPMHVLREE